jgi:hypothetical protein
VEGTKEQKAAFPEDLFLKVFVRAWNRNKTKNDPNFVENLLGILKTFDDTALPASTAMPLPTVPPAARVITQPTRAASSPPRKGKAPRTRSPSISPPPARLTRAASPPPRKGKAPRTRLPSTSPPPPRKGKAPWAPSPPTRPPAPGPSRSRKVVVEVPPRSPDVRFEDINDDSNAYTSDSSPAPTPKKPRKPEPEPTLLHLEIFRVACDRCQRGGRDCVPVLGNGNACRACRTKKYKCSHTGKTNLATMQVTWPGSPSGSEVRGVDTKGKKRKAESPVPARERKAKGEVEKVEKSKARQTKAKVDRPREPAKVKPPARRRAPPKSSPMVVDSSGEEFAGIEIDEEEEEEEEIQKAPKPKRARTWAYPDPSKFFKMIFVS